MGNCIHNKKVILDISDKLEAIYCACPCEILKMMHKNELLKDTLFADFNILILKLLEEELSKIQTKLFSTNATYGAHTIEGKVFVWGNYNNFTKTILTTNVIKLLHTSYSLVLLKDDTNISVKYPHNESYFNTSIIESRLSKGVETVVSTDTSYSALMLDGSVIYWDICIGDVHDESLLKSGITNIISNKGAFAAIKDDKSVITWGHPHFGGDSNNVKTELSKDVVSIYSTGWAFAALKSNGSVITWGYSNWGGDSSSVSTMLQSDVLKIFSSRRVFAALKKDGSVVSWGNFNDGGDSSKVSSQLMSNVSNVYPCSYSFAVLKNDGSVVTWGEPEYGGDSSSVASLLTSVQYIISNTEEHFFTAVKSDGTSVSWGLHIQ